MFFDWEGASLAARSPLAPVKEFSSRRMSVLKTGLIVNKKCFICAYTVLYMRGKYG